MIIYLIILFLYNIIQLLDVLLYVSIYINMSNSIPLLLLFTIVKMKMIYMSST